MTISTQDKGFFLSTSPLLEIDGIEAVIVYLYGTDTARFEYLEIQMPGHHVMHRIGFDDAGDFRFVMEYVDRHMEEIWLLASHQAGVW